MKIMGLCLAPEVWFQAERLMGQPDRFQRLIGTREDVFDMCVRHGVGGDDALRIMQQACHGRLSPEYKDMLVAHRVSGVFLETMDAVDYRYLYPRGQCADYLYWALTLLYHQAKKVAA